MKKTLSVFLMLILLISLMIPAYAKSEEKEAEVTISASEFSVNAGESVELNAVVLKHGSSFIDSWSGAEYGGTIHDLDSDSYISSAVFKADKPGMYTIEYNISMTAGNSNVFFKGKGSVTVEVVGKITVNGADIRSLIIKPVLMSDGSFVYSAAGKVYILWSDGSSTLYSSIFFNFGANEYVKNVSVTVIVSGSAYRFIVPVFRV